MIDPVGFATAPSDSVTSAREIRAALAATEPDARIGARHVDIGHEPLPPVTRRAGQLAILDVTKWFGETSGGVRTYLEQKSAYVSSRPSLRHVLVIPAARDLVTDQPQVRWYRLRGPRIPTQRQYRFLLAARSIHRIIAHERPDVIEVGSPVVVPWLVAMAARGMRIPLISFYHTNLLTILPAATPAGRALEAYARRLDRLFVTTLVASEAATVDLQRAGITRTTRVPLGVDLETFSPRRRAHAAAARARLDVPLDAPLVVYAGRLAPEKELEVAIEGWRRFAIDRRGTLLIVGDGPLRRELEHRAAGCAIRFAPFESSRERLADTLASADAYLAPGRAETFGLSALEAMACGTPLITVDEGAVTERVRASGAGVVYRGGDPESVARALRRCLDGQPARLGAVGRTFVEREHGWDSAFDRIFEVYRDVAARRTLEVA
jgi:alpha-1,6-mannosyltransferase